MVVESGFLQILMNDRIITLEEGWFYILKGVTKLENILEGKPEPPFKSDQYMAIYTTIYRMCTQKPPYDFSQHLYLRYCKIIEDYTKKTELLSLRTEYDEYILKELVQRRSNHKVMVRWLSRFIHYLDRYFIARRSLPSLNEVGLTCFRGLFCYEIRSKAKEAVLALIHKEREGEQIDRELVKNVVDIFVENDMGKYEEDFERFMLQDTTSYYSHKVSSWIHDYSCPEYMLKAEECLKKERERATHYLPSNTEHKLVERVKNELLIVVRRQLLENEHSGCLALLRDNKIDDLSRMYRLYQSIPQGLKLVAELFNKHVTADGSILIKQKYTTYIYNMLQHVNQAANTCGVKEELDKLQVLIGIVMELRGKYMVYVNECFNCILFHKALQEAFEVFCNKTVAGSSSKAMLLATLCDTILKKGESEKLSNEAIEAKLENIVKFLVYISDKDLFAEFYRKKLSRRLLFDQCGNEGHERSILTKLKEQFGREFTSKMEGMVTDMTLARENQITFEEYLSTNVTENPGIELNVILLTSGFWPSYRTCDLNLPSEMAKCVEVFKAFYETKTKHRKVRWIYSLGTCHIIGKFDQKPIELIVNTYQAAVLLLFNNTDILSYTELLEQLNLSHEDLVRLLHSLSCAKYKILIKAPMSESITKTDVFEFNSKFTDRMRRIKIPLPLMDERKKVVEDVERDRRYAIDASLVRIMKTKKVFGQQQLVSRCVEHHSPMFKADVRMIKTRIENLISREYMERDKDHPNILKYLA